MIEKDKEVQSQEEFERPREHYKEVNEQALIIVSRGVGSPCLLGKIWIAFLN